MKNKRVWPDCARCGHKHKWKGGIKTVIPVMTHYKYRKIGGYPFEKVELPIICRKCVTSFSKWFSEWWRNASD